MSQMLELIRNNAVPAAVMRSAAKGALSVPEEEMLQILVHLAGSSIFGQEAALTLAQWDPASARGVLSGSDPPQEVVEYFFDPKNRRPALMPALIENPRISEQRLVELANGASRELLDVMLGSPRVKGLPAVVKALLNNPHLTQAEAQQLSPAMDPAETTEPPDPEAESAHESWKQEHAVEIQAQEGTAFELSGTPEEETPVAVPGSGSAERVSAGGVRQATPNPLASPVKVSTLVKLSRMNVAQRVKQGFLGNKEERAILVRDSAKIVQSAVLASPKVSESEVETFAAAKNVSENVLREIARNRRFMKIYAVVRNLINNPRCPLDVSLTLVKNLLVMDLKHLQGNKNVPDTLRKVATKLFKEKSTPPGQKPD